MLIDLIAHFLRCIRGEEAPVVGIREAIRTQRIALAARESLRTGDVQLVAGAASTGMKDHCCFDLTGRVAVITGGGGLLGPSHARAIARHGGIPVSSTSGRMPPNNTRMKLPRNTAAAHAR